MNALVPWVIAATILLFVAAYWIYTLENRLKLLETRYQKLLALADDADQATIVQFLTRLGGYEQRMDHLEGQLHDIAAILPHTIQGHGIVRYSAFESVGGDQSFSIALVDAHGSGALISGLHIHDDTRVYAKPLTQWQSSYSLGAEEQHALGLARQMVEGGGPVASATGTSVQADEV